ncbi:hypothetical protein T439DRAFT_334659 [Meredithblackwellia eburnea MCA 4105]
MQESQRRRAANSDEDEDEEQQTDYEDEQSHTQRRKSKNKNKKRRNDDEEEEEEEEATPARNKRGKDAAAAGGGAAKKKKAVAPMNDDIRKKLIMEIARYALCCESSRKPFKADDVRKHVLSDYPRSFQELFPDVKRVLRKNLGMELVPMRAKVGAVQTKNANPGPKAYTLRSNLPLELIQATVKHDHNLVPRAGDQPQLPEESGRELEDIHEYRKEGGFMRDVKWEEGASYGVVGVILGLILVNGKTLGEDQLISYLKKVGLNLDSAIPLSLASRPAPKGKSDPYTLSKFLQALANQGYLEKGKTTNASGPGGTQAGGGGGGGRSQKNAAGSGGDPNVEWRWGARAESEIGEAGIARFLQNIYEHRDRAAGDDNDEEDDEEEPQQRRAKGNSGEKMMTEIARAAGVKKLAESVETKT